MYHNILVAVDGSSFGEHAIPWGAAIARRSGATLHLAHVHPPLAAVTSMNTLAVPGVRDDARRLQELAQLEELADRVRAAYDVPVEARLVDGQVAETLERLALECGAALVVMSTHAHSGLSRLWHHGVAERVNRDLPLPVLLVHAPDEGRRTGLAPEPEFRNILVALDGCPLAEEMLAHAAALAGTVQARCTLLHVIEPPIEIGYTLLGQHGHVNQHRQSQEERDAHAYLETVAERVRAPGLELRNVVVASADPAEAILEYVRTAASDPAGAVDLIAMESHPHGAVSRYLGSHVVDEVLRDSPVPVLIYQPVAVSADAGAAEAFVGVR